MSNRPAHETDIGIDEAESALPALDPVIHAQARLRVVTVLASVLPGDRLAFPRLQELLEMTAGNLSTHLRKLEAAGYVDVEKAHRGRTPVTWIGLSGRGRRAYEEYVDTLRSYLGWPTNGEGDP